jgi:hypothetical protein
VNRSPAFDRFVFARFPVDHFRHNLEAGFNLEVERSLIGENNFDDVVIGRERQFNFGNDLAFCLSEFLDALIGLAFDTLGCSHSHLSLEGIVVRAASGLIHRVRPVYVYG